MNPSEFVVKQPPSLAKRWDVFCRVIDNFGDAGVCWRLAQQLSTDHHQIVHLWIDDLSALAALMPIVQIERAQQIVDKIVVHRWVADTSEPCLADVVVEAFACELPTIYLQSMAERSNPPRWINLEYLSAEKWVEDCHGLASPHPSLGLKKYFFFPGFTDQTGGLLWGIPPVTEPDFLLSLGVKPEFDGLTISFFAYDHIPANSLLHAWKTACQPIRCLVPPGKPRRLLESALGQNLDQAIQHGQLTLIPIPFLSQTDYDRLLLACNLNFVRGEDSFVRAQWAGKPMVWQIYPQDESAHKDKLHAFLARYSENLPQKYQQTLLDIHRHWNQAPSELGGIALNAAWNDLMEQLPTLTAHAKSWAEKYREKLGLAENLVKFSRLWV